MFQVFMHNGPHWKSIVCQKGLVGAWIYSMRNDFWMFEAIKRKMAANLDCILRQKYGSIWLNVHINKGKKKAFKLNVVLQLDENLFLILKMHGNIVPSCSTRAVFPAASRTTVC